MRLKNVMRGAGLAALAIGALLLPGRAEATHLVGTLDISGAVRVTETGLIDWLPVGGGTGVADVENTSTGYWAPFGGTTVTEKDLDQATYPTGPAGTFAELDFFETLSADPSINFVLTAISPCSDDLPFTVCAAGNDSPFRFAQSVGGSTITMVMFGYVYDTDDPDQHIHNWTGIWTAQFPGETIAQLFEDFDEFGYIDTSYSASKISVALVPEPMLLGLFGAGLAGAAVRARRRRAGANA